MVDKLYKVHTKQTKSFLRLVPMEVTGLSERKKSEPLIMDQVGPNTPDIIWVANQSAHPKPQVDWLWLSPRGIFRSRSCDCDCVIHR